MDRRKVVSLALSAGLRCAAVPLLSAARTEAMPLSPEEMQAPTGHKYLEAQDHMRKARELLREYLATNPSGNHGYFATRQLKALGTLIPTEDDVAPVNLSDGLTWRVLKVEARPDHTKVTLEITNTNATRNNSFNSFETNPLVIVANGHLYPMKEQIITLPASITRSRENAFRNFWSVQAGVTTTLDVTFEGFDEDVNAGVVRYATGGKGATFNRMNIKQVATP